MVASFFDRITRLSLRFRWVVIILTLATLAAGVVSMTQLNLALLPSIEFPQTFVVVQWAEADSVDDFVDEVTIPVEEALSSVDGVVNVESTTGSGFAFITARYEFGISSERVLQDIESGLDGLALPEGVEPEILNFSLDDLPVVTASVSSSELSLAELKALVSEDLLPELQSLEEVSEATVSGGQELPDETIAEEPEEADEEPVEDPGRLPIVVREGASSLGLNVEYIQEVTPEMLLNLEGTNEEVLAALALLPPELLPLAQPDSLAILPSEYIETLDPDLQTELDEIAAEFGGVGSYTLDEVRELEVDQIGVFPTATIEPTPEPTAEPTQTAEPVEAETAELPEVEAVDLPESWVTAAAQAGQTLETTADVTPEVMEALVGFAPELLSDLTPDMWRAFEPAVLEVALPAAVDMDPALMAQLEAIVLAANGEAPEPIALPESWVAAAAQAGQTLETTDQVTAESLDLLAGFAPELLNDLTPDHILAFPPDVQAAMPEDYVAGLDEDLQATLAVIAIRAAQYEASQETEAEPGEAEPGEAEPTPTPDPARLPEILIQGAQSFGVELEYAYDITPEFMRQIGSFGGQAIQILQLMTPDNLRALQPEVIALLPAEYLETMDADLRAELDELAAEYGGAGALALEEAAAAEEAADDAPPLSGPWLEPGPDGSEPLFTTAADILNNQFPIPGADVAPAAAFINFLPESPQAENPAEFVSALDVDVIAYLAENEEPFVETLNPAVLRLMSPEVITYLLDTYPDAFDADLTEELRGIAAGDVEVFIPDASITRTDGNPSVLLNVFKDGDANTVVVAHRIFDALDAYTAENPEVTTTLVFEQATFIEDAIAGVSREGVLGAAFAIFVILIFLSGRVKGRYKLSWRATIVVGVSIPLSVFTALLLMRWVPPILGDPINNLANESGSGFLRFLAQLFPTDVTLNIMTLSGLTVAIGRVVDDSIVVLENTYRFIQRGDDPVTAAIEGTKEVAIAIFTSTVTTMAVFLPLGLLGGVIGSFFLPFGLTVTYALAASFVVSITVVPALSVLMIRKEHIPEEVETWMQKVYTPSLKWALNRRVITMALATLLFAASLFLLFQLPLSFIPAIGEPTLNISVELPGGTSMVETNEKVEELEAVLSGFNNIETIQAEVGSGGGFESFFGGGSVSQNIASLTVTVEDQEELAALTNEVRQDAEAIFGEENVTVSAASQTGFSGFSIIVTGDSMAQLEPVVDEVKQALSVVDVDNNGVPDIANVSSNVDDAANGTASIIRIDGRPAISFSGELETDNTLGVTNEAKTAVAGLDSLPVGVEVTEGFDTQQQTEGFQDMVTAILYSIILVYLIMALSFRSLIHPFTILFSLPFALVGAALALFITSSVLGISSMIGMMMLVGIVVTNAIVLLELVQQLRNRGENAYEALVEGGRTRLRPIWMTALTAILALIPLALSQEAGAIIAGELARAVIGGLLVSTLLTLIVVPVVYSLFDPVNNFFRQRFSRKS